MSATGEAALRYARRGLRVLPLHTPDGDGRCSCGRDCPTPGKHPRTQHGAKDATTDEAAVRRYWDMWPSANVGIATGDGLAVVDIDPRSGGDGALESLQAAHGREIPDTAKVATGGGGWHHYFEAPAGTRSPRLGAGLELKGEGAYVVAPPSIHASGREYTWIHDAERADAPAWLLEAGQQRRNGSTPPVEEAIPEGRRNSTLLSLAGSMRRRGMGPAEIEAALEVTNAHRCQPPLDADEVRRIAESVQRYDPEESAAPVTFDAATGRPLDALDLVRRDFPELSGPNEIARVVKLGGKQSSYIWELAGGETVELGSAKELLRPRDAQAQIFDATGVAIPVPKLDVWREVVQRLHAAAEVRAVTLDEREETADWLDDFLHLGGAENFVQRNPDRAAKLANLSQRDPTSFVEGNVAFVRLAHLRRHVVMYRREEPISTKKLSERLGRIGYRRRQIAERDGGEVAKGRFYAGPWGGGG